MRLPILVGGCALVVGCTDTQPALAPPDAQTLFATSAWPALAVCNGCHGKQPTIDFLAPGTPDGAYATIFAFDPPIVDLQTPSASLVLTMGKHTGPALSPPSASAVLAWIVAEQKARVPVAVPPVEVGPVTASVGAPVSIELPLGAQLSFVATAATEGLYLSQLQIVAGTAGLHVVHPLFVSLPAPKHQIPDDVDRFGDVDAKLAAGETLSLGGGDAWFLSFAATDPIAIYFTTLEAP